MEQRTLQGKLTAREEKMSIDFIRKEYENGSPYFSKGDVAELLSRIAKLETYIKALESEPVRSKSVIKRLKVQSGVEK